MSLWDNERVERYIRLYRDPREKKGSQSSLCSDVVSLMVEGSVADFGCGMGHLAAFIEDREYLGIDLSEKMLEKAREFFPDKKFIQADVTTDRLKKVPVFDNAVAVSLALHLKREDARWMYQIMWDHTSPGGIMIFSMETNGDTSNVRPDGLLIRNQPVESVIEDLRAVTGEVGYQAQVEVTHSLGVDFGAPLAYPEINWATQKKTIQIIQEIYMLAERVKIVGLSDVAKTTLFWVNKPVNYPQTQYR